MKTRCLYGDSTPFPLGERFLEMLRALTATAVDLLQVAHTIQLSEGGARDGDAGPPERDAA